MADEIVVPKNTFTGKDMSEWQNDTREAKIFREAINYPEGRLFVTKRSDNSMEPLEIFIPGRVRAKQRPRFIPKLKIAITPKVTVQYENLIRTIFIQKYSDHVPIDGDVPLELLMIISFAPPKSTSKKKRVLMLEGFIKPTKKPDVDNVLKNIDALNKIAFYDDSQIVDARVVKKYAELDGLYIKISEVSTNQTRIDL